MAGLIFKINIHFYLGIKNKNVCIYHLDYSIQVAKIMTVILLWILQFYSK